MKSQIQGVIEDITEGEVVILAGEKETIYTIPVSELPPNLNIGDWVKLSIDMGHISDIVKDLNETEKVRKRITEKMAQLRTRKSSS